MKRFVALLLCLALILGCASAVAETRKFSFSHVFQTDHPVHVALLEANEMLKEKSGGTMELEIYPNGTYATYNDAITAVQMGALDFACRALGDMRIHSSSRSKVFARFSSAFSSSARRFCFCSNHEL